MTLRLPDQNWSSTGTNPSPVVPAATLNNTAPPAADTQLTVAADHAPLRVIYGRCRVGAQIANVVPYGSSWVIQAVWGEGEIDSVESVWNNDKLFSGTVTHYLGTPTPPVDPTLAAAFASNGIIYTDNLVNVAYSVFVIPADIVTGMPQLAAIIKGRKIYDHRTGTTAWSDNPALVLADFLSSQIYGLGWSINWPSADVVANACDESVGAGKRRAVSLVLDAVQDSRSWLSTLRTYAGCWVFVDSGNAKLVADRPRATDKVIAHAAGQISKLGIIKKRGTAKLPNRVEVRYTDTSATPWRDASVFSPAMGVGTGIPDSQVALPGIQSAAQAYREAVERLNKLWASDLSLDLELFDDGLAVEVGDVIEVTHPIGLSSKKLRVMAADNSYGRFRISGMEYDEAVYSDAVVASPTYPDTNLPNPSAPPIPTGLALLEEVYQQQDGTYTSRIKATWTASAWPYVATWRFEVWEGPADTGTLIYSTTSAQPVARSPGIQEGKTYTTRVATLSSAGAASSWVSSSITANGKYLPPGPPGTVTGFEAGGTVYLAWGAAVDIDIWKYQVKRGTTAQAFSQATLIDTIDALRYTDKTSPTGIWRFWIEAVDSVKNVSGAPVYCDVTVTLDSNAFLVNTYDQTAPTLTAMREYWQSPTDGVRHFVTDDGVAWNTAFSGAMSGYTNPLYAYFATAASAWQGETEDFGQDLAGSWLATATVEALAGSVASEIQLAMSATPTTWVGTGALTAKANGRFARLKHTASAGACLHVQIPTQNITLDAIPREEVFAGTSSTSGPVTVNLTNAYVKAKKITVSVQSTTAAFGVYDNVVVGSPTHVDVYVFDNTGTKVAKPFTLIFQGV